VSATGRSVGAPDAPLARIGRERRVGVVVPIILVVADLPRTWNMIAMLPQLCARPTVPQHMRWSEPRKRFPDLIGDEPGRPAVRASPVPCDLQGQVVDGDCRWPHNQTFAPRHHVSPASDRPSDCLAVAVPCNTSSSDQSGER
jgi:hypothetical protein